MPVKTTIASLLLRAGDLATRSNAHRISKLANFSEAERNNRVRQLLRHATAHVPFYQNRIKSLDPHQFPNLSIACPITNKDDVELHFPDGMTDESDPSDWRMMATRGTAQRLITVHDFSKRDAVRAAMLRTLQLSGYRPGMPKVEIPPEICEIVCGDEDEREEGVLAHALNMVRSGKWRDAKSYRDLRGLVERQWVFNNEIYRGFGAYGSKPPNKNLQSYVDRLRSDRPAVLKALATYLIEIAKHVRDSKQKPLQIPIVKTMGSRVTPRQRKLIENSFGGVFWDDYGSAEFGSIANECDRHSGMHLFDDMFVVEIVDNDGATVPDGTLGWILITDLTNMAMPLIRYRIGDVGILDSAPCECGKKSPRLLVLGRAQDTIVDSNGEWRTHDDVVDFVESLPGIDTCVVECRGNNRYSLNVIPEPHKHLHKENVAKLFADWIGTEQQPSIRITTTIPAEAGGKFRYVRGNLVADRQGVSLS